MVKEKILQAYEEMAEAYNERIDHKPHNAYYDRPNTLSLFPDNIQDCSILDAACGPGKYAEILMERGAKVTGFDLSPSMIDYARTRNKKAGTFFVHDLSKPLTRLGRASFDFVLCALAMHYIEDWTATLQEFYRVLKPKGCLIISTGHPFSEYEFFESKKYFETEQVRCTWKGFGKPIEVNSYRRPLSACLGALTNNGFYIDQLIEPKPTKEFEQLDPKHFKELNAFPAFMCIRAVKRD